MGYFATSSDRALYHEQYCSKCVHCPTQEKPCHILGWHMEWNYDQLGGDTDASGLKKQVLNSFIQRTGITNGQCAMFIPRRSPHPPTLSQKVEGVVGLSIPLPLSTPAFKAAWEEWLSYRRARKVTMLNMTLKRQLMKLALVGEVEAIATINRSIDNGWTGLFPDKRVDKSIKGTAASKAAAEAVYQRTQRLLAESRPIPTGKP